MKPAVYHGSVHWPIVNETHWGYRWGMFSGFPWRWWERAPDGDIQFVSSPNASEEASDYPVGLSLGDYAKWWWRLKTITFEASIDGTPISHSGFSGLVGIDDLVGESHRLIEYDQPVDLMRNESVGQFYWQRLLIDSVPGNFEIDIRFASQIYSASWMSPSTGPWYPLIFVAFSNGDTADVTTMDMSDVEDWAVVGEVDFLGFPINLWGDTTAVSEAEATVSGAWRDYSAFSTDGNPIYNDMTGDLLPGRTPFS